MQIQQVLEVMEKHHRSEEKQHRDMLAAAELNRTVKDEEQAARCDKWAAEHKADADAISTVIAIVKAAKEAHDQLARLKDNDFVDPKGDGAKRAFTAYLALADHFSPPAPTDTAAPRKSL
jgi:hypothetical protein